MTEDWKEAKKKYDELLFLWIRIFIKRGNMIEQVFFDEIRASC
jgi:hypothetical protein